MDVSIHVLKNEEIDENILCKYLFVTKFLNASKIQQTEAKIRANLSDNMDTTTRLPFVVQRSSPNDNNLPAKESVTTTTNPKLSPTRSKRYFSKSKRSSVTSELPIIKDRNEAVTEKAEGDSVVTDNNIEYSNSEENPSTVLKQELPNSNPQVVPGSNEQDMGLGIEDNYNNYNDIDNGERVNTRLHQQEKIRQKFIIWDKVHDCQQPHHLHNDDKPPNPSLNNPGLRSNLWGDDPTFDPTNKKILSSPTFRLGKVTVKAEEIGLVLLILLLWAGAITLFINRWGKLRMLEPYQPQFSAPVESPRGGVQPPGAPFININIQSTSSFSLNENCKLSSPGGGSCYPEWSVTQEAHGHLGGGPRRSIGGSPDAGGRFTSSLSLYSLNPQRKVRSAVDLVSLVMQEKLNTSPTNFPPLPSRCTATTSGQSPSFTATNV